MNPPIWGTILTAVIMFFAAAVVSFLLQMFVFDR